MLRKSSGFAGRGGAVTGRGCSERVGLILRPLNLPQAESLAAPASLTGLNQEVGEQLIRAEGIETLSCCPPYVFDALAEGFASRHTSTAVVGPIELGSAL